MRLELPQRRWLRWLVGVPAALLAAFVVLAIGIVAHAEWQTRTAPGRPAPAATLVIPAADASTTTTPVLILLHGAGLNGHMWDAVRRGLDPRWRVIALDLPGHGARRDERFTLDGASAAITAAARSVAPAPVLLVGDSLGGYSAMAAASALPPAQLRGLVLAGSSANRSSIELLRYLKNLVSITLTAPFIDEPKLVTRVLGMMGQNETDSRAIVEAGIGIRAVPAAERSLQFVDFRAKLAAVTQPVLIANGSLDSRAVDQEASFVAAAPHATSYRFEHCEHGVSLRRSAEFARMLNDFAARAFAAAPPADPPTAGKP